MEIGVLDVTRFAHRQRLCRELSLRDDSFVAVSTWLWLCGVRLGRRGKLAGQGAVLLLRYDEQR